MKQTLTTLSFLFSISFLFAQISFQEVALEKEVRHTFTAWTVGGGVSFFDFNQDGLDDLTLSTNGGRRMAFYINRGNEFELIPPLVSNIETVKQILWVDYDNDGDYDLYVAAYEGINRLYQNTGHLQLVDVTESSGLSLEIHRGYGACWGDYNRDGWLDLYYNSRDIPGAPDFKNISRLFKNNADGSFTETTIDMNAEDAFSAPFSSAFIDYNNDNWPDIYTANDKYKGNTLLENKQGLIYEDVGEQTKTDLKINGMCVTSADWNKDGWSDIYITNTLEGNKFLVNTTGLETPPIFEERADELGIAFHKTSWGANFLDADNDGDLDLYVSGAEELTPVSTSSIFYENIYDELFEAPRINGMAKDTAYSFSNAIGDFNNDGLVDIIVQNNPPFRFYLWENKSRATNNWLKVKLEGVLSNRDAIGCRLEAYAGNLFQSFYTQCGLGFLAQNSAVQHIGLGRNEVLDSLLITWPTGHIDTYYNLPVNQLVLLKEGDSTNGLIHVDSDIVIAENNFTTPTREIFFHTDIALSPNPGNDLLTLRSEVPLTKVLIYSANGVELFRQDLVFQNSFSLATPTYPSGVYLVKVYDEDQRVGILKWVKL